MYAQHTSWMISTPFFKLTELFDSEGYASALICTQAKEVWGWILRKSEMGNGMDSTVFSPSLGWSYTSLHFWDPHAHTDSGDTHTPPVF